MKRAVGCLVVAGLIGGAVWIGLRSQRPPAPLRVASVEELAQVLSGHGLGCGHADRTVPGMPPRGADYGVCEIGAKPAQMFVFENSAEYFATTSGPEPGSDGGWIVGQNYVVTVWDAELAIAAAKRLGAEVLYDPARLAARTGSRLQCPEGDLIQGTSVLIGGPGFIGSPEDAVREALSGIRATDVLSDTGSTARTEIHIFRDDNLIGKASAFRSPKGGWLVDASEVCTSAGIRH